MIPHINDRCEGELTVDTTPPTVFIDSPVEGLVHQASVQLIYGASDGTVTVTFDGAPLAVPSGGTLSNLGDGSHTLIASSTDTAVGDPHMPRKARLDAPGALHHIIVRGIRVAGCF